MRAKWSAKHSDSKQLIDSVGCEYVGEAQGMVWFNDPRTRTTLVAPLDKLSAELLRYIVWRSRRSFCSEEQRLA